MKLPEIYLLAAFALATPLAGAEDKQFEAWKKNMEATEKRLVENHRKTMNARIDELIRICQLEDAQVQRFRLAAKGAIERTVETYMVYQEKQWQRRKDGNRGAVIRGLTQNDQNPVLQDVWLNTVSDQLKPDQKKIYDEEMEARARFYVETYIRQIIQQLDNQSRFSAKQRAVMKEQLEKSIPLPDVSSALNQSTAQVAVYKGLAKVPDEPFREVLSKDQFNVWKEYKNRYAQAYKNR